MKNYFGRLVSARSGRGVLRPPRMLFGAAPRVAAAEPAVSVSRGTTPASQKAATSAMPAMQRPASADRVETGSEGKGAAREERVPPPVITPALRDAPAPIQPRRSVPSEFPTSTRQASRPVPTQTSEVKKDEVRVRPVSSSTATRVTPPNAAAKPAEDRPAAQPVMNAAEEEGEERRTERSAEVSAPVAAERSPADATLRPASAKEAATPDVPRIPVVTGKAMPPALALRSLAEGPRQEALKIEIGTIEVRIAAGQKRAPMQSARAAEAPARAGTLARRFFHSFGMRQG